MSDFSHEMSMIQHTIQERAYWVSECLTAPHVLMRPQVYLDGDSWCALYGKNIQDGVAGFGDSPQEACNDFDKNWKAKANDT